MVMLDSLDDVELEEHRGLHRPANEHDFDTLTHIVRNRDPELDVRMDNIKENRSTATYDWIEIAVYAVEGKYVVDIENETDHNYYLEEGTEAIEGYVGAMLDIVGRNNTDVYVRRNELGFEI